MFILVLVLRVYVRLLVRISVSVQLFLNVSNGVRLYYDSLYVHKLLCIVFVCVFRTKYLYWCSAILALIVRIYVCLLMRDSLWIALVVFLTLFLSECLHQCSAMLSLIVRV